MNLQKYILTKDEPMTSRYDMHNEMS